MKLYKLTDQDMRTHGGYQWELGKEVTVEPDEHGERRLCTRTVLHAYRDPLLAVLMNPIHADIDSPRLFEAEGEIVADDGAKVGCSQLRLVRELDVPQVTVEQRIRFAVLCALEVCDEPGFVTWAQRWLLGEDRTAGAAWVAADAADAAGAETAARAAAGAATTSAGARVAETAAWAAVWAVVWAAEAAARAEAFAAKRADVDLVALARRAVEES